MCFLQAFVTSVGIITLTYSGLMANQRDDNHHNYNNKVEDTFHTRVEFHQFREKIQ